MTVERKPLNASLRVTNFSDEVVHIGHRFKHDLPVSRAEYFLDAISQTKGIAVGNGYLTVQYELVEA